MRKEDKKAQFNVSVIKERIEKGKRKDWWRRTGGKASGFKYLDREGKFISDENALDEKKLLQKNILKAVRKVAEHLGNTPTVARGSYIHPLVLKDYESGITLDEFTPRKSRLAKHIENDYEIEENALIKLFKKS